MVKILLGDIDLEVTQETLSIYKNIKHKVYDLIDGSQSIIASKSNLDIIEFSGFIYNVSNYNKILKLISDNESCSLIVTGLNRMVNTSVLITEFETSESGGDLFCIDYSIKLIEYKKSNFTAVGSLSQVASSKTYTYSSYSKPSSYTVVKGDNLWSIAKKFLGDGNRYTELATLNNIKNPSLIYPGQVILF